MPKDKSHYAFVLSLAAIVSIALLIIACGSGNSNSSALTQAQAQAIATAVSNDIGQALAGTFGAPSVRPSSDALRRVETGAIRPLVRPACPALPANPALGPSPAPSHVPAEGQWRFPAKSPGR